MTNGSIPKDMPQDEIIKEYIEQKIQYVNNGILSGYIENKLYHIPLLSTLNRKALQGRLKDGFQVEDAALPANVRAEVVQAENFVNGVKKQIETEKKRIESIHKGGKFVSTQNKIRLTNLEQKLNVAQKRLDKAIILSSSPKYMRDAKVTDTYVLLGGIAGGEISQNILNSSPAMGEGLGIMAGIVAEIAKGSAFAVTDLVKEFGYSTLIATGKISPNSARFYS